MFAFFWWAWWSLRAYGTIRSASSVFYLWSQGLDDGLGAKGTWKPGGSEGSTRNPGQAVPAMLSLDLLPR